VNEKQIRAKAEAIVFDHVETDENGERTVHSRTALQIAIESALRSMLPPPGAVLTADGSVRPEAKIEPDLFWPDGCDEGEGAHDDLELIADRLDDGTVFVVQQAKQLPPGYYVVQTTADGMTGWRDATEEEIAAHKQGEAERLAAWKERAKVLPSPAQAARTEGVKHE